MPLMVKVGRKFGQSFGKHSVHIVTREQDCQHLYSLFFELTENDFLHWVINNGCFLQDLIANYNLMAKDIILAAKSTENRIILPNSNEKNLSIHDKKPNRLRLLHKKTNMPIVLSKQQSACILLLSKGKSAKEIGFEMGLSSRTVEHYLERIKNQLGCATSKELIASYHDQLLSNIVR